MRLRGHLLGSVSPVWNTTEGGGGGAGAGAGAGGGGQQQAGGWKAPDGLAPEFLGKDADETLGKVLAGYTSERTRAEGLRTELATRPGAAKTPDEYTFAPDEALKPYFPDVAKDPIIPFAREAFHKAGVPAAAFQPIISDIYTRAIAAGVIQQPYNPANEIKAYGELNGITDKTIVGQHMQEAEQFASGLAKQLNVPEAAKKDVEATLLALTDTAAGNMVLRAIRGRLTASGINIPLDSTGSNNGPLTEAEAQQLGSDPRIDPKNRDHRDPNVRFDPALRKRYDDAMGAIGRAKYAGKQ